MRRIGIWVHVVGVFALTIPVCGDTVYLKNGAYIDGVVRARSNEAIDLEIGKIGKLEIPLTDIDTVEKNNRTGDGRTSPADPSRVVDPRVAALVRDAQAKADKEAAPEKQQETEPGSEDEPQGEGEEDEGDAAGDSAAPPLEEPEIAPELKAKILQHVEDLKRQKAQYRTRAERHLRAIGPSTLYYLYPVTTHESELTRVAAVRLISEYGDETSIETCLDRLLDPSEFVRDFAHRALERITQQSFGFQASATPRRREMAYSKWRKWWEAEKAELAATEKLKRASRTQ